MYVNSNRVLKKRHLKTEVKTTGKDFIKEILRKKEIRQNKPRFHPLAEKFYDFTDDSVKSDASFLIEKFEKEFSRLPTSRDELEAYNDGLEDYAEFVVNTLFQSE